ncbi:AIG2 family [Fusarium beomiforme]|uniref:gamma-glutamylcyclotransferase n=1 Tax=Fusarium beomiforme TaxID=44412 RepID=A0A9P5E0S1_9HYPO|nr:AIG2 family [Fusarium beomiforme]
MSDLPAQLYFAYGSNLWLQQMASRCPESYFVGRAILLDHRWQINTRGFANVIPCSGYNVHGLVYQISVDDETRLDRNEGVHSGAYTKSYHSVVLHEAIEDLQLPTRYLVQDDGLDQAVNSVRLGSRSHEPERECRIRSNVLVYLSSRYSQWGTAREEYIDRMNRGIRDGCLSAEVVIVEYVQIHKSRVGEAAAGAHHQSAERGVHFNAKRKTWGWVLPGRREFQHHIHNQLTGDAACDSISFSFNGAHLFQPEE